MTIQDDYVMAAARQLAKDIDTEVLMSAIEWKPFTFSESRVSGARYLTVHPNNGASWNEMMEWMVETFGPSAHDGVWTPGMRWYANNAKFWFRNQKDLDWFILRWGA
jgi:hypothetical protein